MKHLFLLAAIVLFSSFSIDDEHCLEIKGSVTGNQKKLDKLQITLYENGKEVQRMDNAKSPFKFELPRNHYYSLEVIKEGYLPAVIIIDTKVPKNKTECGYHFTFEYEMITAQNTYNQDYVDFPAAIIEYIKGNDEFIISDKYNSHIKSKIGIAKN